MKTTAKTVLSTLLASAVAFGTVNIAHAIPPEAQQALNKATISASQALSTAQAKVGNAAKVKALRFIQEKYGKGYFRIDFLDNQQIQIVDVDATSGEILGSESKAPKHLRVPAENTELKISLAQAIEIAENKTHAKVAEAGFKGKADKSFYLIETANDGQTFVMAIDAQSGKTIDAPMPPHGMSGMPHDKGDHPHFGEHSKKGKHSNQDGHSRKGEHQNKGKHPHSMSQPPFEKPADKATSEATAQ